MKLFFIGAFASFLLLLSGPVKAQILPSVSSDSSVFEIFPTEVWHYGKAGAVEGNVCIFSNLFNNGFVLQLLEKDEVIRAMVIDFGQAVFEEGRFYPFILSVNGKPTEVRGVAVTRSSIRFNLTVPIETKEFETYATNNIKAKTEESDFVFFLNGLSDAMKTINGCSIDTDKDPLGKQKFVETDINEKPLEEEMVEKVEALEPVEPVTKDKMAQTKDDTAKTNVPEYKGVEGEASAQKPLSDDALITKMEEQSLPPKEEVAVLPITNSKRVAPVPAMDDDEVTRLVKLLEAQKNKKVTVPAEPKEGDSLFDKQAKMFKDGQAISRDEALSMMDKTEGTEEGRTPQDIAMAKRDAAMSDEFKWHAKKGERLSDVLARWADQSGVKIKWQADQDPVLDANIALDLPFEKAVSVLMESVRQSGEQPFYASLKENADDVDLVKEDRMGDWRALLGMDLHAVLESWSDKAQVKLIWDIDTPYRVQKEYRDRASYAQAVTELLDQFKHLKKRPVAQLNVDPVTGQLALIVQAQRK